jgi:arylsulfatase
VPKRWADIYKGQFDDGWDAYREKVFKRQKELAQLAQNRGSILGKSRP